MIEAVTRRADLEAIPCAFPEPFLVEKLAPYLMRRQEGGTLYYQSLKNAPTAQYNRDTANLASITATTIAAASTSYSGKECRARIQMSYDQIRTGYYDQASAEIAMAKMAKRAFYLKLESLCAYGLLHNANPINGISNPLDVIDSQIATLRDKAYGTGKVAVTMSHDVFARLKKNAAIIDRMKATGVIVDGLSPRYVSQEQLAAVFGADEVLVGSNAAWHNGLTSDNGNVGISVLPTAKMDCMEEPQWARTVIYDFGGDAEHYVIEEFANPINDSLVIDAKGIIDFQILNASMAVQVQVFNDDSDSL